MEELLRAKRAGPPSDRPNHSPVPKRVHDVVLRGLAPQPEDRWQSMNAFLRALRRARRRRIPLIASVLLTVFGLMSWLAVANDVFADECALDVGAFEVEWEAGQRRVLATLQQSGAQDALQRSVADALQELGTDWVRSARSACVADGGERIADEMTECLRVVQQSAHGRLAVAAQSGIAARMLAHDLELLPRAAECDERALAGRQMLPADPDVRREVRLVRDWLDDGRPKEDSAEIARYLERAQSTGHFPTLAAVQIVAAMTATDAGDTELGLSRCSDAFASATSGGDEWAAYRAASVCMVSCANVSRSDDARRWNGRLDALARRLDVGSALEVSRRAKLALALAKAGELDEAGRLASLVANEASRAPHHARAVVASMTNMGVVAVWRGEHELAVARFAKAYQWASSLHADDTETVGRAASGLAAALRHVERYEESETLFQRALALQGPGPERRSTILNYSLMLGDQPSRVRDGLVVLDSGAAESMRPGADPTVDDAHLLTAKAQLYLRSAQPGPAREALRAALRIYEQHLEPGHIRLRLVQRLVAEASD